MKEFLAALMFDIFECGSIIYLLILVESLVKKVEANESATFINASGNRSLHERLKKIEHIFELYSIDLENKSNKE